MKYYYIVLYTDSVYGIYIGDLLTLIFLSLALISGYYQLSDYNSKLSLNLTIFTQVACEESDRHTKQTAAHFVSECG